MIDARNDTPDTPGRFRFVRDDERLRSLRSTGILVYGLTAKAVVLMRRYRFDTIVGVLSVYVFFFVLFAGGTAIGGARFTRSLDAIVVGFFLFSLVTAAYSAASSQVLSEAEWGTLEQLYISPCGFGRLVAISTGLRVTFSLLVGGLLLGLMMLTTGRFLRIDTITVLPLLALTLLPAMGVGFVFGGLALVYKRVQSAFQLVRFAFVGLIALPVETHPGFAFLPVSLGSHLLRDAMTTGTRLWEFDPIALAKLAAVGGVYFAIGYATLLCAIRVARRRGVLGHY